MKAENMKRVIDRVQVKELIRRQAIIKPDESMFTGVDPIEYAGWRQRALPDSETVMRRVLILEKWIDSELPPMPVPPKK